MKARIILATSALLACATFGWALFRKHHLGSDLSPDQTLRADYSYQVRSPLALVVGPRINPIYHLEVVEVRTGKRVLKERVFGDYAELAEAREFLAHKLPWRSLNQPEQMIVHFPLVPRL